MCAALLALLMPLLPAAAQQVTTTPSGGTVRVFTEQDGLPGSTNTWTNYAVTREGYRWISTQNGTVRLDGQHVEEIGEAYGVPQMLYVSYDTVRHELWFADAEALVHFDGSAFRRFDEEDGYGIPGGARKRVSALYRDRSGALWIGSNTPGATAYNGGLVRFHEGTFTEFSREEFPLHDVAGIFEASDGSVWFTSSGRLADGYASNDAFVARYRDGAFERFDPSNGFECLNVPTVPRHNNGFHPLIVEDRHGHLWFGCSGRMDARTGDRSYAGVVRYDGSRLDLFPEFRSHLDPTSLVRGMIYQEETDEMYVSMARGDYSREEAARSVLRHSGGSWHVEDLSSPMVTDETELKFVGFWLVPLSDGSLLAQLQPIDPSSVRFSVESYRKRDGVWHRDADFENIVASEIAGGYLVIGSPTELIFYFPSRSRIYAEEDGLLKTSVSALYADRTGHVWITYIDEVDSGTGTINARGLSLWDGERIRSFSTHDGLAGNITSRPFQDSRDRIWIPTEQGLTLAEGSRESWRFTPVPLDTGTPYWTTNVLERSNGEIWSWTAAASPPNEAWPGRTATLARFDGSSFIDERLPFPDSLMAYPFQNFELTEDRSGRLWLEGRFAVNGAALTSAKSNVRLFDGDTWVEAPAEWDVPDTRLYYVGELDNGRYYVVEGGFFVFDGHRFVELSDSVTATADFRMLKRVNPAGMFSNIQGKDHLYIRFRDRGLAVFDGTTLAYFDRRRGLPEVNLLYPNIEHDGDVLFTSPTGAMVFSGTDFQSIRNDAVRDGVPRSVARDRNGNIVMLYSGLGLTVTRVDTTRYPLHITSVSADTLSFMAGSSPSLNHRQNNVRFRFASVNFYNPEETRYTYYLDGYDRSWSEASALTFADFRNLPHGRYTFRVRGISPGGVESDEAAFTFRILPPFWRTWWAYLAYGLLFAGGVVVVDGLQRRRLLTKERERARERELEKARELERAYHALEESMQRLKDTQAQLVQQAKLASLGALTAGIAHEIKNPLNFVNNFAQLSDDLIQEIEAERKANPDLSVAEIEDLLADLRLNATKIAEHGRRADGIVRSMLDHSRGGSGERQPTDVNAMLEEYLNLAYHGLRAQQPDFNVTLGRDYDPQAGKVEVVPQEMGRVLLNLLNNAMYAANEKREKSGGDFSPAVQVSTRRQNGRVEVRVRDNGNGIPADVRRKIFEPFFTTKPTGKGTGLGLSLSHDIVVQGHGGSLAVETEEGQYTEFIVTIPAAGGAPAS